jgi:hypothetical protein
MERAPTAELITHLGHAPHARLPSKSDNARNDSSPKTRADVRIPRGVSSPDVAFSPFDKMDPMVHLLFDVALLGRSLANF